MPAAMKRCPECRGASWIIRNGHGTACPACNGLGVVPGAKDIPPAVRALLAARSGGVCEVCHRQSATDAHHRQFRRRGGLHTIQNLLHVCGPGNVYGCHGRAHGNGGESPEGVSIQSWDRRDPADIPFTDQLGYRWILHPDGTKEKLR